MKILFRVDASVQLGTGHMMRCLTLAEALRSRGGVCHFVCREGSENLLTEMQTQGFEVSSISISTDNTHLKDNEYEGNINQEYSLIPHFSWLEDAKQTISVTKETFFDWLIVDHYLIDIRWEKLLRNYCRKLMVIDDLANRQHDCDLLLDQNYYCAKEQRYLGLLPDHCVKLLGPNYALLRPEFDAAREKCKVKNGIVKRILVFFGGSDPTNQTEKVIDSLRILGRNDIYTDVVVGCVNPNRKHIEDICRELPYVNYHCNVSNMADLMLDADLSIGAGGSSMWERCYLGLPTITVVFAYNQLKATEDMAAAGAIEYVGWAHAMSNKDYAQKIYNAINNPHRLKKMSETAFTVIASHSTASVIDVMERILCPVYE